MYITWLSPCKEAVITTCVHACMFRDEYVTVNMVVPKRSDQRLTTCIYMCMFRSPTENSCIVTEKSFYPYICIHFSLSPQVTSISSLCRWSWWLSFSTCASFSGGCGSTRSVGSSRCSTTDSSNSALHRLYHRKLG